MQDTPSWGRDLLFHRGAVTVFCSLADIVEIIVDFEIFRVTFDRFIMEFKAFTRKEIMLKNICCIMMKPRIYRYIYIERERHFRFLKSSNLNNGIFRAHVLRTNSWQIPQSWNSATFSSISVWWLCYPHETLSNGL